MALIFRALKFSSRVTRLVALGRGRAQNQSSVPVLGSALVAGARSIAMSKAQQKPTLVSLLVSPLVAGAAAACDNAK